MITGARPSVGSSSIKNRAPVRRMRAIASICCSPPESLVPWLLSRSFKLGNSSKIWSSDRPPSRTIGGSKRVSRTSRLAKIPRSSGQNAIPMRAILSDAERMISLPSKRIEPERLPIIPITDFSVLVLPAPLRPGSVTTSPGLTWKLMPCRMWDSPYQASRFCTNRMGLPEADGASAGSAIFTSTMACPQIGFLHAFVFGEVDISAFRQHVTARQHGDDIGQVGDDGQIMFDHQDGVLRRDALDQRGNLVDVLVPHPRHRLVEQHHFGVERQRGRNFQRALAAVRHLDRRRPGKLAQADVVKQFMRAGVETVEHGLGTPEVEGMPVLTLQRDAHVLQRRQMREHCRDLKRSNQAEPRHIGRRHRRDVLSLVEDLTRRRPQKLGEQIETGRLAGPIRTDQGVNTAATHLEADVAYSKESREFLGQSVGFENELIRQSNSPARAIAATSWVAHVAYFYPYSGLPQGSKNTAFVTRVEIRPGTRRLRPGICRQRPSLCKAESGTDDAWPLVL